MSTLDFPPPPERLSTGISGLEEILRGGLFRGGIYVVIGDPGAGKTILSNQICFHHAKGGGRAAYVTLLAETHARMIGQMRALGFFEGRFVGSSIQYVNAFSAVESEGLKGLLQLLRRVVREQAADLLVVDGMITASALAPTSTDYKKFINELQTWVGVLGCTVLLTTGGDCQNALLPEHSMVDGIIELFAERLGRRTLRQLQVRKLRGSDFLEGRHTYEISADGVRVYPRLEATGWLPEDDGPGGRGLLPDAAEERAGTGVSGLDALLDGSIARGTATLVLGPSGSGKTLLGLQFLCAGARAGEPGLYVGFHEDGRDITREASPLGLELARLQREGALSVVWQRAAEPVLDVWGAQLLEAIARTGARRVFIDGLAGLREAGEPERLTGFLAVLLQRLRHRGVTTYISDETQELYARAVEVPAAGVSVLFHNILLLRQLEHRMRLVRLLAVVKARGSAHDRALHVLDVTREGIVLGPPLDGLLGDRGEAKATDGPATGAKEERG